MEVRNAVGFASCAILGIGCALSLPASDYPYSPAVMTNVTVTGGFWLPRIETNRLVTLRSDFEKCELARIPNFRNAAARNWGTFKGIPFDDSDVFKVIEGAAYTLSTHPDPELEKYVDGVNEAIAGAQEPDGYLYTARTLGFTYKGKDGKVGFGRMGATRWSYLAHSHEFYNVGHLYEAAVAYWETTGKRTLLDAAIRSANLIDRTFGPEIEKVSAVSWSSCDFTQHVNPSYVLRLHLAPRKDGKCRFSWAHHYHLGKSRVVLLREKGRMD